MKNSKTIRQFSAAFFLLLFSFCVTPKRFLHDLLANHRDAQTISSLPQEQIAASGFHCNIDDLVVVAPFLPEIQTTEPVILNVGPVYFSEPIISIAIVDRSQADNRGPPSSFCS